MKCEECKTEIVVCGMEYMCPTCGLVHGFISENKLKDRHKDNNNLGSIIGNEKGSYKLRRLAVTSKMSNDERSLKKAQFYCSVVSSEFTLSKSSKECIEIYYSSLKRKLVFTSKMSLEDRVAALGYIVIKEYGYHYTLQEVSKKLEISTKRISKLARLFARKLGKSYLFSNTNVRPLIEKFCLQLDKDINFINEVLSLHVHINKKESHYPTSSYLAALVYLVETTKLTKTITQKDIADVFGIKSKKTIYNKYKTILQILGIKSTHGLTIDDITEGMTWEGQEV